MPTGNSNHPKAWHLDSALQKGQGCSYLMNWHPISLLNVDYKCVASRIKEHLCYPIHSDQTGLIKERYIGENINKIVSLMDLTSCRGLLLQAYLPGKKEPVCQKSGLESHFCSTYTLRKDFVILQLYWWLFSSTKHCS